MKENRSKMKQWLLGVFGGLWSPIGRTCKTATVRRTALFGRWLSYNQISDRRKQRSNEQRRDFGSSSREKDRGSVDYLQMREEYAFSSAVRCVQAYASYSVNE